MPAWCTTRWCWSAGTSCRNGHVEDCGVGGPSRSLQRQGLQHGLPRRQADQKRLVGTRHLRPLAPSTVPAHCASPDRGTTLVPPVTAQRGRCQPPTRPNLESGISNFDSLPVRGWSCSGRASIPLRQNSHFRRNPYSLKLFFVSPSRAHCRLPAASFRLEKCELAE